MKILNSEQYINEKLNIQPITKDRLADISKESNVDEDVRDFINQNNLVLNRFTRLYDCKSNIKIPKDIIVDGKFPIRFGIINGSFICSNCMLTSLDGAPQEVGGNFDCGYNQLTSLKGAPKKVGGYFWCNHNQLTTLEGSPQKVGGCFGCNNNQLTSLEGSPQEVGGYFDCSCNQLTSHKGAPQKVCGNFWCKDNTNLKLPKEKPSWIKGDIIEK